MLTKVFQTKAAILRKVKKYWSPPVNNIDLMAIFHRASLFRNGALAKTAMNDYESLQVLSELSGESVQDLVIFSPARMLFQESMIACDIRLKVKDDGRSLFKYSENFQNVFGSVFDDYIKPEQRKLSRKLNILRTKIENDIDHDLDQLLSEKDDAHRDLMLFSWVQGSMESGGYEATDMQRARRAKAQAFYKHYKALQGKELSPKEFRDTLKRLVLAKSYNQAGRDMLNAPLKKCLHRAIDDGVVQGLPTFETKKAIVHAIHGTPAVGKSTMRPRIRKVTEAKGETWDDVMVLNADVWRRLLLDKDKLGKHKKYWGPLTDNELSLMWGRMEDLLNRQDAQKPHILIDHFFPNSFSADTYASRTDRFHTSFLFAHPEQILERSMNRGDTRGRYIPNDSLLFNISTVHKEFDLYIRRMAGENVRVEIIDNSVAKHHEPHTVAYGDFSKKELNVFDVSGLMLIDRYGQVNPSAQNSSELFKPEVLKPTANLKLLNTVSDCLTLNFVDLDGHIYAQYDKKKGLWICDSETYEHKKSSDLYRSAAFEFLEQKAETLKTGISRLCPTDKLRSNTDGMLGQPTQKCNCRSVEEIAYLQDVA